MLRLLRAFAAFEECTRQFAKSSATSEPGHAKQTERDSTRVGISVDKPSRAEGSEIAAPGGSVTEFRGFDYDREMALTESQCTVTAAQIGRIQHAVPEFDDCRKLAIEKNVPLQQVITEALRRYQESQ